MSRIFIEDFLTIYNTWSYVVDWFNITVLAIILETDTDSQNNAYLIVCSTSATPRSWSWKTKNEIITLLKAVYVMIYIT